MIDSLVREHLRTFKPYTSARSEVNEASYFLDANELALGSPVAFGGIHLNRYPDPYQSVLRSALAARVGVSQDMVFVGAGSDEIIDLLIRLFCEPSRNSIVIAEPTYGVYRVAANVSGVEVIAVELDSHFQLDVRLLLGSLKPTTKIIFVCSPNNPTGNLLRREDILAICRESRAVVVVDQAYVEFAELSGDLAQEVNRCNNLVILRTLSKAWGLAGIRLGYAVCNPSIVSYLLRIKAPYNINSVSSELALDALKKTDFLSASTFNVKSERNRLENELKSVQGVRRVYSSQANFLLVEFADVRKVYEDLLQKGIVVRRRHEVRLSNCLRVTVGSPPENGILLTSLRERS